MSSPPSPAAPLLPGVQPLVAEDPRYLGRFRLVGRLGAGGMGMVYAALDDQDLRVAVKCVHRVYASDGEFRARFTQEVDLVRRVRAACVPRFLGADTKAEVPWLATEYVPGPTLDEYVREHGPMSGPVLNAFALGVAEALAAVHAAGVVHRDLKPGNVILSPQGPKVLDFGIARAAEETGLTRTGGLVGTPGWISPEQFGGSPATGRSDMFAWAGAVAYAATGRNAFGTGTSDVLTSRILHEPPDLDGVPEELRDVLARALAKDPAQRPDAAGALAELVTLMDPDRSAADPAGNTDVTLVIGQSWDLAPAQESPPERWRQHAPPRRSWLRRNRRAAAIGAGALTLVLLAGTGVGAVYSGLIPTGPEEGAPGSEGGERSEAAEEQPEQADAAAEGADNSTADDVPEEYQDLLETGEVVVEPVSDTELVRGIEPAQGAQGPELDQVRIEFVRGEWHSTDRLYFTLFAEAEYLPDFGEMSLHSNDFRQVGVIEAGQDSLYLEFAQTSGEVARVDPGNPTEEFSVEFRLGSQPVSDHPGLVSSVYYLPDELLDEDGSVDVDYPGGFCFEGEEAEEGLPGPTGPTPQEVTFSDGDPIHTCVPTEGTPERPTTD